MQKQNLSARILSLVGALAAAYVGVITLIGALPMPPGGITPGVGKAIVFLVAALLLGTLTIKPGLDKRIWWLALGLLLVIVFVNPVLESNTRTRIFEIIAPIAGYFAYRAEWQMPTASGGS